MSEFKVVPEGQHVAVIYGAADIGTHDFVRKRDGQEFSQRQVVLAFEVPGCTLETTGPEGDIRKSPMIISETFKYSLWSKQPRPSKFSEMLVAMSRLNAQGRPVLEEAFAKNKLSEIFHLQLLVGQTYMIQVGHRQYEGKTYDDVNAVYRLPEGTASVQPLQPTWCFDVLGRKHTWDQVHHANLPDWVVKKVQSSKEAQPSSGGGAPASNPFGGVQSAGVSDSRDPVKHPTQQEYANQYAPNAQVTHHAEMDALDEIPF